MHDLQLTKHFKRSEFACGCAQRPQNFVKEKWQGCGGIAPISFVLVGFLEQLRHACEWHVHNKIGLHDAKVKMQVTSGVRCKWYNIFVKGTDESRHLVGDAADVKFWFNRGNGWIQLDARIVGEIASKMQTVIFVGIGIYDTFTHLDIRTNQPYWRGDKRNNKTGRIDWGFVPGEVTD